MARLQLSQDPEADAFLEREPLALVIGMLLDQQVPLERAFSAPHELAQRIGGDLDAGEIAAYDPEQFASLASQRPAIHRFPGSMAKRIQQLCQHIVQEYDGDVTAVWTDVADGRELLRRVSALPGFGKRKAQIFVALLGKQLDVRPDGWREAAGEFGEEDARRSVADVTDQDTLLEVRDFKQQQKRAGKQAKEAKR